MTIPPRVVRALAVVSLITGLIKFADMIIAHNLTGMVIAAITIVCCIGLIIICD